jgi:hypothetical protein
VNEVKVRDSRRPGHFWADNELLYVYGPNIGIDGIAVYMALSVVANNHTGECVITLRQIAEMLGTSPQTAMRAIGKLITHKLVRCEEKGNVASRKPSIYTLLEIPKTYLSSVPIGNSAVPVIVPSSVPSVVPIGNTLKTINTINTENTKASAFFELTPVDLKDPKSPTQKEKQAKEKPVLPDWLPIAEWNGWLEMRKQMRKPATALAQRYALDSLDELRISGENVREVMRRAIQKNWLTFYAVSNNGNGHAPPPEDALERERRKDAERISMRQSQVQR